MSNANVLSSSTTVAVNLAGKMLRVQLSETEESQHHRACRQIRERRFCPPVVLQQAIVTLSSPSSLVDDASFAEQIAAVRLEEFHRLFFSINKQERQAIWLTLDKQLARMPQLRWRLRMLERGLLIDSFGTATNPAVVRLANQICEMFVMSASECRRSLRGICMAAAKKDRGRELGDTIDELYRQLPEVADLKPMNDLPEMLRRFRALEELIQPVPPVVALASTPPRKRLFIAAAITIFVIVVFATLLGKKHP